MHWYGPLMADVTVEISGGRLRGRVAGNGAAAFLGVPFAADPVGPRRFAAPAPHPGWTGERDATSPGPAVPQPPGRLNLLMGTPTGTYDEAECLNLNVWTPDVTGSRPVLLWIHGGASVSGSGGWDWYAGARLAADNDIVVVTANYRLGALGYLDFSELLDGFGHGNFGLLDQMAALEWVAEHIASFGGDPAAITVGGQSAGAEAAAMLAASPRTGHLVRRVIMQSGGINGVVQSQEQSTAVAKDYLDVLGIDRSNADSLRELDADALLAAQVEMIGRRGGGVVLPFNVVADEGVPAGGTPAFLRERATRLGAPIDVLVGWTRDELFGFYRMNPQIADADDDAVVAMMRHQYGDAVTRLYEGYSRTRPSSTPGERMAAINADQVFLARILRLADERVAHDETTYVYRFDWAASPFGACHCIDLPFTFGNLESWGPDAAMLGDVPRADLEPLSAAFGAAIGSFVRTGRPSLGDDVDGWPAYESGERTVAVFGSDAPALVPGLGQEQRELFDECGL